MFLCTESSICQEYHSKLHLRYKVILTSKFFFLLVHVKLCDEFQQQFSETCGTNPETAFSDLVFDHLVSPCVNEFLGLYSQYHRGMRCYSHVNFFMGVRLFALDRYYLH